LKGNEQPSDHSHPEEEEVKIGAVRVDGRRSDHTDNEEGANPDPELQGRFESHEFAVEAHIVEETSVGLLDEERQKLERETRERLLSELAGDVAQAEVVINEDGKEGGRSFVVLICVCLVLVVIASIATGVLVSRKKSTEERSSSSLSTSSPYPSRQPSLMPTSAPLNNTFCEEAHQLFVGQNVTGSFEGAFSVIVVYCESGFMTWEHSPGFWYVYRGEGFPVVILTDDSVNIYLYLECSGCACNEEEYFHQGEGGSRVQWEADLDTDYFILVSKIIDGETISPHFTLTFATNDSLETAFGPLVPAADTIVAGSTVGTRVASDVPACGAASIPSGPGVWYSVVGNGRMITASTCNSPTALDTQISVFSIGYTCEDGNDDYCSQKSKVAWSSTVDELYYVLVHGKSGAEGNFVLQLATEGDSFADADFCGNAVVIEVNSNTTVDLSKATDDPDISDCTEAAVTGYPSINGNFYRFTGTGQPVGVRLDFGSYTILNGPSCSSLVCQGHHEPWCCDGCGECEYPTDLGQYYYVYVYYVVSPPEGNMTLTIYDDL
jgi:hypothetical protein